MYNHNEIQFLYNEVQLSNFALDKISETALCPFQLILLFEYVESFLDGSTKFIM